MIKSKLPPYRIFRQKPGAVVTVLQIRDPETGEAVNSFDLECYVAKKIIKTPWHEILIRPSSRLLLTPNTARFLLAAGTVATMEEPGLILSREIEEGPGGPPSLATETARKARSEASPRKR